MLYYSDLYIVEPLPDDLWILTFSMLIIILLREVGFKLVIVFDEVIDLFISNSYSSCITTLGE